MILHNVSACVLCFIIRKEATLNDWLLSPVWVHFCHRVLYTNLSRPAAKSVNTHSPRQSPALNSKFFLIFVFILSVAHGKEETRLDSLPRIKGSELKESLFLVSVKPAPVAVMQI